MSALFSDHTFRHYAYLRDSLSHLVPPLRVRLGVCWDTGPVPRSDVFSCLLAAGQEAVVRAGLCGLGLWFRFRGIRSALSSAESEQGQHHPEPGGAGGSGAAGLHHTVNTLIAW